MDNKEFLEKIKALNDNTRLVILQMLSKNKTLCACKILEELSITQGTLSHHMKVLTNVGFVSAIKSGKWCYYTLVNEKICEVSHFLQDICKSNSTANSCNCNK